MGENDAVEREDDDVNQPPRNTVEEEEGKIMNGKRTSVKKRRHQTSKKKTAIENMREQCSSVTVFCLRLPLSTIIILVSHHPGVSSFWCFSTIIILVFLSPPSSFAMRIPFYLFSETSFKKSMRQLDSHPQLHLWKGKCIILLLISSTTTNHL